MLFVSLAVLSSCSPAEGQEETLLGPDPTANECSADAEAKVIEVYDPETGIAYTAVIDPCGRVVGDQGGFLSGDEPGVEMEMQQLAGW